MSSNINVTSLTAASELVTNLSATNLAFTAVSAGSATATIGTVVSSNINATSLTAGSLLATSASATNLAFTAVSAGSATATIGTVVSNNLNVTSLTGSTALLTSVSSTNITTTNILITHGTVTGDLLITGNSLKAISNSNTVGAIFTTGGNVGIANTAPNYRLDVNGDINFTGDLYENGSLFTTSQWTGSIGSVLSYTSNSVIMTNASVQNITTTNVLSTNLSSTNIAFTTVSAGSATATIGTVVATNVSATNETVSSLLATNISASNITVTNTLITDATVTGTLILGNSLKAVSNSNTVGSIFTTGGNVGISNTAPSYDLDVTGDINLTGTLYQNGAPFSTSQWTGSVGSTISYTSGNVNVVNATFTTGGNVGIGNTAPNYDLDVTGDVNFTGDLYKNGTIIGLSPSYITRSAQTVASQTISAGSNILFFPDAGQTTNDITYNTTGTFTVNKDGLYSVFVDVDTYNAIDVVDLYILKNNTEDAVNGRIAWVNNSGDDAVSINAMVYLAENDYITVVLNNNATSGSFTTPYAGSKVNSFAMSLLNVGSTTVRNSQWIGNIGSDVSYTSGNVLMNDVTVSNILITNATVTGTILILGNSLKAVSNSNTVGNIFTTGGNVGIGTTAPSFNLTVNGTIGANSITTGALAATNISVANLVATNETVVNLVTTFETVTNLLIADDIRVTDLTSSNSNLTSVTAGGITVTSGGLRATFNSNTLGNIITTGGNVGIGTTSPNGMLHTYNTTNGVAGLTLEGGFENFSTQPFIRFGAPAIASATNGYAFISTELTGTGAAGQGGILNLFTKIANTANYNGLSINQGNVGIGTTAPSTRLQVDGVVKSTVPSWNAYKISHTTVTAGATVTYNNERITAQNCTFSQSTGILTATVAGRYFVFFHGFSEADSNSATEIELIKNSSTYIRTYGNKSASLFETGYTLNAIVDLAVNDTVSVKVVVGSLHGNANCSFGGYLIG